MIILIILMINTINDFVYDNKNKNKNEEQIYFI